ncbi:hypothetical protein [Lacrimispora xylanisolvens]|uniref:hypothetical protein n=1 Tax=Lacrimispora xylanisolvens TaxID=384636 RepID=UPI002402D18A
MNDEEFYTFRTEIRKNLGRIIFFPENTNIYVDSIIQLIEKNEEVFLVYIKNCTKNEKTILTKVLNYLKETNKNRYIENLIEENL